VRPGWFDYNGPDEHRLVLLQGDRRHAGDLSDGVIARRQLAEVLVRSLTSDQAVGKTFELVATKGPASGDFDALFTALEPDSKGALDGVRDMANMPLDQEPSRVRDDLDAIKARCSRGWLTRLRAVPLNSPRWRRYDQVDQQRPCCAHGLGGLGRHP